LNGPRLIVSGHSSSSLFVWDIIQQRQLLQLKGGDRRVAQDLYLQWPPFTDGVYAGDAHGPCPRSETTEGKWRNEFVWPFRHTAVFSTSSALAVGATNVKSKMDELSTVVGRKEQGHSLLHSLGLCHHSTLLLGASLRDSVSRVGIEGQRGGARAWFRERFRPWSGLGVEERAVEEARLGGNVGGQSGAHSASTDDCGSVQNPCAHVSGGFSAAFGHNLNNPSNNGLQRLLRANAFLGGRHGGIPTCNIDLGQVFHSGTVNTVCFQVDGRDTWDKGGEVIGCECGDLREGEKGPEYLMADTLADPGAPSCHGGTNQSNHAVKGRTMAHAGRPRLLTGGEDGSVKFLQVYMDTVTPACMGPGRASATSQPGPATEPHGTFGAPYAKVIQHLAPHESSVRALSVVP
ncbi:unnamed protein product, partial [Discosporangium mesarthrocarpum]